MKVYGTVENVNANDSFVLYRLDEPFELSFLEVADTC